MIELAKQPFRGARLALEEIGQAAPDRLERETLARLVVIAGDYGVLSQGPLYPNETISLGNGPVVARFSLCTIVSRDGFWLHGVTNRGANQLSLNIVTVFPVLAGVSTPVPVSWSGVPSTVVYQAGDSAASTGFDWNLTSQEVFRPRTPIWVPPGRMLSGGANLVNVAVFMLAEVSQARAI
jgi:hypothetical protein